GKLSPVNTATKEFKLEFKLAGVGKQEIEKFETGLKDTLETSKNGEAFEGSGEEATSTLIAEKTETIEA
ncbi:MAG: hypothetical protein JWO21_396, partial [Solirubrobacterales bacterium]|nr:hypothetical protein [Solirubrobacterales bacterium]